jgi:hypothetical protein
MNLPVIIYAAELAAIEMARLSMRKAISLLTRRRSPYPS